MASTSTATSHSWSRIYDDDGSRLPHAVTPPDESEPWCSSTSWRMSPWSRGPKQHRPSHGAEAPSQSGPASSHASSSVFSTPTAYSASLSPTSECSRRSPQGPAASATPASISSGHAPRVALSNQVQRESDAREAAPIADSTPSKPRAPPPTTPSRRHSTRSAATGTSYTSKLSVDDFFAPVTTTTTSITRGGASPTASAASAASSNSRRRRKPDARTAVATPGAVDWAKGGQGRSQQDEHERTSAEYEALQKRYSLNSTSPILPKVKLAFPLITSDEEDGWSTRPSIYAASSATSPSAAAAARSAVSPERNYTSTTTTTTTTRRTEHRTWTYSMPPTLEGSMLDLTEEDSDTARKFRDFGTADITYVRVWPQNRCGYGPPSGFADPGPLQEPRRALITPKGIAESPPLSVIIDVINEAICTFAGPEVWLEIFTLGAQVVFYDARNASTFAASTSSSTFAKYGSRALTTTPHFAGPVLSALTFLLISTMACLAIGSVLVSSIALTFYDDCGERIVVVRKGIEGSRRRVRGSIEDVRAGVGRVVGGARGAVELVVWATSAQVPTTSVFDNFELDLDYETFAEIRDAVTFSSSSSTAASEPGTTPERGPTLRNSQSSTAPASRPPRERQSSSTSNSDSGIWTEHEEDNLPFTAPFTTPHPSRSASPTRGARGGNDQARPQLPPRPPLSILVPSIIFALTYTIWTVLSNFWRMQTADKRKA
ncbi:BZ3500_MvSof-1268-A1-R1_Chr1-1g00942 [Microbotryum saponariae]|uniref:BZ3500_MvSof-1268-A1-R1_Chr1-1g00942 protein n=1 Tax=Microbotryum saponariae TaxID=289078 RepID=A0A2X0L0M9_9BASI|nr:BZ3500_MvSof-1268-A1-R1_Chr1-1g00942 [Microbotryum saponariae]SCZ92991.1 BZ3501_MvSof-1269-A2-R1_Chr1-1g00539 [Microbotryum saponariae]